MKNISIVSYNLNGLRSVLNKGLIDWIKEKNYDVICFQEIKASEDQFDETLFKDLGYQCCWFPAEKKGYSGTAILSKIPLKKIRFGMHHDLFDKEGRVIRADIGDTTLICAYFPSGSMGDERQTLKMEFLEKMDVFLEDLRENQKNIIITGDFNIAHKEIDINNPKKHTKDSGFLPEERTWMDNIIQKGWLDTFRQFNTEAEKYSWWSYRTRAKEKNLGWRIDYFLATENLKDRLLGANILAEVNFSDHCPILLEYNVNME